MTQEYNDYVDEEVAGLNEHSQGCMCEECWCAPKVNAPTHYDDPHGFINAF